MAWKDNNLLTNNIIVPENVIKNWQVTVNLLAECANTPAALIMRVHPDEIEVLLASDTVGNPYRPGEKQRLGLGLYCEKVMASRAMLLVPDALQDPEWSANPDIELGMISYCGFPLVWPNDDVFGTICVLDNKANAHNQRIIALLERFKDSICYSLAKLYEAHSFQSQLTEKEKNLKYNLIASVEALAAIVEMRDPYTAGHQRHVAELAVAIARELHLSEFQIEGLYLAGVVHDIGKNCVPAEILCKTGKLSQVEYGIVKEHAANGYKTLKDIGYPWPIAQMILQHHERLDGSGYPNGLMGEQILFEATILSVADVIDAMMSHRPYRPGLGIESALSEIESNKDKLYNAQVAEAAIKLFRTKNFSLLEK